MPSVKKSTFDKREHMGIADDDLNLVSHVWQYLAYISDFNFIAHVCMNCPLCPSLLILKGFGNYDDNDTAKSRGTEKPCEFHGASYHGKVFISKLKMSPKIQLLSFQLILKSHIFKIKVEKVN